MRDHSACVGFVHTTPTTIGMAEKYMKRYLPEMRYVHMYDGTVKIDNFNAPLGHTPRKNLLRYAHFAEQLESAGCDIIISCCSLMPRAVAYARSVISIPFIQLDASVQDTVVEKYSKIGVINTTEFVIPYVEEELNRRATELNKQISLTFSNNNTALDLFNAGEYEKHDAIVIEDVKKLAGQNLDCIFMGQIPFALLDDALSTLDVDLPIHYVDAKSFAKIRSIIEGGRRDGH